MKNFRNKVAVITGAGSGIGRALAQQLDKQGALLSLSDVNEAGLKETLDSLSRKHYSEILDVADRDAVYANAEATEKRFGPASIVINNAGVAVAQTIEDLSYDDFEWIMDINFWGMVYGSKAYLPQLKQHKEAAVANVSSVFGLFSLPTQGAYNASKFAIRGFTEALRAEMAGTGLSVHSIHPGGIRTDIAKNARFYVGPGQMTDQKKASGLFDKVTVTTADSAARTILKGIQRKQERILIGPDARVFDAMQRSMPVQYSKVVNLADKASKFIGSKVA
ncbi:MAG: SDR family NAD(P)-dependent oxidoreductase [Gammaproteobacteria bacterium]|nr:SDR family NAD(P)-dependent oxidoreductase [Gammaproteobacteria bacterium]